MKPFRLPDATHLSHVHLRTGNLARALEFYQAVIGLQVIDRSPVTATLSATGSAPAILILTEDPNSVPRPQRTTGLYHLAIRYPTRRDLAHALVRLVQASYPISGGSDHPFGCSIYLDDPDGNGVELYFDLPRSQWPARRNGLIVLAGNAPLDFDRLLASVDGDAVPAHTAAGTDMGHINLNVPDLAAAEKFYRDFLGFEITARIGPGGRFLATGGYHHNIAINTWAGKTPAPKNAVELISYRLAAPNSETLAKLEERARLFGHEVRMAGDVVQIRDPNGHWLELELAPQNMAAGV
jgi:catechol 2,3-dioxygenase